jgi:magnesium transporter
MVDEPVEQEHDEAILESVLRHFDDGVHPEALEQLAELHPADQADVVSQLDEDVRAELLSKLSSESLSQVLAHLRDERRLDIVEQLPSATLAPALDLIDFDIAVDVLHDLPAERARETLRLMDTAADVAPLLPYGDETAGGRMTSAFVSLQQDWTVDQALAYLRRTGPTAEQVFYLYVTDNQRHLEGVVSLRELVVSAPDATIGSLMTPEVFSVYASDDQEEVLRQIQKYNFIALPVVDAERRLMGVISVDDIMDVAEEEATEDMYRLAGLEESESLARPIRRSVAGRLIWLLVVLASGFASAGVINAFDSTIDRYIALAVFMPVISGMGGNAGVQTVTLVVRSMALGELDIQGIRSTLGREILIGTINGLIIGLILGVFVFAWKGNLALSLVAGLAMLLSMGCAVTAGVLVPVSLRAVRLDPALASGALLTTLTDVLGFFFFLGLAALMIDQIA